MEKMNKDESISNRSDQMNDREDLEFFDGAQKPVEKVEMSDGASNLKDTEEIQNMSKMLMKFPWFHGVMLKEHLVELLRWPNSFLVRYSIDQGVKTLCMSVKEEKKINHYRLSLENGVWVCSKFPGDNPKQLHVLFEHWSLNGEDVIPIPRAKTILCHSEVKSGAKLGSGAFGDVWRGTVKHQGAEKECAIKKIKGVPTRNQLNEFFMEAKIMSLFDHDCVVRFYGICCLMSPIQLVMELASRGSLRDILRKTKTLVPETMLSFILDISRGMSHLNSKSVIHRDLAARNCLVTNKLVVKISDFGLSVIAKEMKLASLKKAPLRWFPPETLERGVFNEKTDVWSFGVVIWEIFTKCATPPLHPKTLKEATMEIKEVECPHKLPNPLAPEIVEILEMCTKKSPDARPRFQKIVTLMTKIVETRRKRKESNRRNRTGKTKKSEAGAPAALKVPSSLKRKPKSSKTDVLCSKVSSSNIDEHQK